MESLEQQLADSEKKAVEANQKGTFLTASLLGKIVCSS